MPPPERSIPLVAQAPMVESRLAGERETPRQKVERNLAFLYGTERGAATATRVSSLN